MDKFKSLGEQLGKSVDKDKLDQVEARLKEEADGRGLGEVFDKAKGMLDQALRPATQAPGPVGAAGDAPAENASGPGNPTEASATE